MARHVIRLVSIPHLLTSVASQYVASDICMVVARHVIKRIANPRTLSQLASHDARRGERCPTGPTLGASSWAAAAAICWSRTTTRTCFSEWRRVPGNGCSLSLNE